MIDGAKPATRFKKESHPPLEGGSKKSEVRERQRADTKSFSGRGIVEAAPLPEIFLSLTLKNDFDPPSRGGWKKAARRWIA
jgi:hypothetical protein